MARCPTAAPSRSAGESIAEGILLIDWREEGGPPVTAPTRRGFGSTIIERSIPFDLGGKAEMHYRLSGFERAFLRAVAPCRAAC